MAGNANDPATGSLYGAVASAYQISKNETTITLYAEFLNAAAQTDTYGLWNSSMGSGCEHRRDHARRALRIFTMGWITQ